MHQDGVVLADQLLARKPQQLVGAVVDEGEAAFVVQRVDEVGRAVDQVAVQLFRLFQLRGDAQVGRFEAALLQCVGHRFQQLLAAVGLAQIVVGAALEGADRRVDADFAAHHDDIGIDALLVDEVHDVMAAHVGQSQVEQHQVEAHARQVRQRFGAARGGDQVVVAVAQQFVQRRQQARLVVDQQDAGKVFGFELQHRGERRFSDWVDCQGGVGGGRVHHHLTLSPLRAAWRRRSCLRRHAPAAKFRMWCRRARCGR